MRLITDGLQRREPEKAVVEKLLAAGVSHRDAPKMYTAVKTACQQGVQSIFTEGLSAPDGVPKDPLLAEAFRVGQASMRGAVRTAWLQRLMVPLVILAIIAAIVWFLNR